MNKNKFIECPMCGNTSIVPVPVEGWNKFQQGELVQNAFPEMDRDLREVLVSGLCVICQKKIFAC